MDSWSKTRALIAAARGGDRNAFDRLVEEFSPAIEAFLHRHAGRKILEKVESEDLLQETFLRAFRSIGRFEGADEGSFLAWLRAIADHVVLDHVRKLRAGDGILEKEVSLDGKRPGGNGSSWEIERELSGSEDTPLGRMRRDERFERLKRVMARLKPDHAQVIFLARVRGLPIREVARKMERTPEATSMLLFRALLKLKAEFGETESFHLPDRSLDEEAGGGDGP